MTYKKKLIEVALPLKAINEACAYEKTVRIGKPLQVHQWWARRPLAACRAVLFASLVDDPSTDPQRFPTVEAQEMERERLFDIIKRLVLWENTTNQTVLAESRAEIMASCGGNPPPILDPFCGGGSIPLEAQRLGLEVRASDLNPVAVLIVKALVEIPHRFNGRPPVHPREGTVKAVETWLGAQGLAADFRHYGAWLHSQAVERIGHLYPRIALPKEYGGGRRRSSPGCGLGLSHVPIPLAKPRCLWFGRLCSRPRRAKKLGLSRSPTSPQDRFDFSCTPGRVRLRRGRLEDAAPAAWLARLPCRLSTFDPRVGPEGWRRNSWRLLRKAIVGGSTSLLTLHTRHSLYLRSRRGSQAAIFRTIRGTSTLQTTASRPGRVCSLLASWWPLPP